MSRTWLLFDCNNLCYRAFFAMGQLSHWDVATGVIFGFMRDILRFQELYATKDILFCFDSRHSIRKEMYPKYKSSREALRAEMDENAKEAFDGLRKQIKLLRTDYLPRLGYSNIFHARGYEADDCIASVVKDLPKQERIVIVSSDKDLYQLLSPNVSIRSPQTGKTINLVTFGNEFGIKPKKWPLAKAMAGCNTDDITGIDGIGEKTACKYILGNVKPGTKTYDKIKAGKATIQTNLPLVRLPLAGCPSFDLDKDCVTPKRWKTIAKELGMDSIADGDTNSHSWGKKKKAPNFGL